jgi:AcrR family transcriptional regulator
MHRTCTPYSSSCDPGDFHIRGTVVAMAKRSTDAPRERLRRDAIVSGAIALADREGLEAVTIRRLAQDHGVTPMALYWHFREKDELYGGIAEYLYDQVELPCSTHSSPRYGSIRRSLIWR